ncbi:phosphotransferase [Paenibacillus sp. CC-CFT747]|nr:phosphotransferase [Paenibacillus sp. CC-CFT747]
MSGAQWLPPLLREGEELLADPAVERLMATERKAGAFVHGDYNYPNVVLDRSHRLHLIDMENASLNVRVMDLAHILHRNCPWNADGIMTAIAEYDRKRPLGPDERFVLYALLVLPYPLVRAIRMYDWRYPRYVALPSYKRQEAFAQALLGML